MINFDKFIIAFFNSSKLPKKDSNPVANYSFNALGNRVMKYVNAGDVTMKMLYDGADCVADYDANTDLLQYYITPMLDENLLLNNGSADYYYTHDGLGSVKQILDSSQNTENDYDFVAFGSANGSPTENIYNRFKFTGRELDSETASANSEPLYYYRARTYDPAIGSFTGRDPIGGLNLYCNYKYLYKLSLLLLDFGGFAGVEYIIINRCHQLLKRLRWHRHSCL